LTEKPRKPDPRRYLVEALHRWERRDKFAADLLEEIWRKTDFSGPDRALITATLNGVIRRKLTLDWLIDRFSSRRAPARTGFARQILRLSLFHLLYLDTIPPHAILHQAGELARKLISPGERSYLNGLLRSVQRAGKDLPFPDRSDRAAHISVVHSHARWLVKRWGETRGWEEAEEICRADNLPPPVFTRCNRLKTVPGELGRVFAREGVSWAPVPGREEIGPIKSPRPLVELDSFKDGLFLVQDISTLRPVEMLAPVPGERIADLCAAPGGKTVYISEQMENTGRLLAADPSPARLNKLQETITRCGVANALVRRVDLLKKDPGRGEGLWDGILLDVPCSNTGVLRRRVDARWRIGYDDIIRLANQGLSLLAAAAGRLRAGGRIVYSTCSLEPEENEEAVKKFLQLRPDYSLEEEESGLPREEGGDGYYAARLRKAGLKPTG
jgi:16S rRNA (cytosine967-C5)-methyltransferase